MPIEIKELTIKVNVNQEQGTKNAPAASNTVGKESEDKESFMKEAAEQVLRILENKKER